MSQSIEVNGKTFTFKTMTFAMIRRLQKKQYEQMFNGFSLAMENDALYRKFKREWKKFCNNVFVPSTPQWRVGMLPKELNLDGMKLVSVLEVAQAFFAYVLETQKELNMHFNALEDSKTQNK